MTRASWCAGCADADRLCSTRCGIRSLLASWWSRSCWPWSSGAAVQRLISGRRQPAWVRANTKRRRSTWLKPYVDPYGFIAVLLGGIGWGIAVETSDPRSRSRGRQVLQLIAGPLVLTGLGIGMLAIFRAVSGVRGQRPSLGSVSRARPSANRQWRPSISVGHVSCRSRTSTTCCHSGRWPCSWPASSSSRWALSRSCRFRRWMAGSCFPAGAAQGLLAKGSIPP